MCDSSSRGAEGHGPTEAPATRRPRTAEDGDGATSVLWRGRHGEDEEEDFVSATTRRHPPDADRRTHQHARLRPCPRSRLPRVRRRAASSVPSTPAWSASARSRSATTSPTSPGPQIEAGPQEHLALPPLLPVPTDIATIPNTEPGCTRLIKADNLARELGIKTLWVKDDSGNPTHSFKDRVVAVALAAARELGLTRPRLPVDRQPGQRRRRRRSARRHQVRRLHPATTSSGRRSSPLRCTAARWSPSRATTTT